LKRDILEMQGELNEGTLLGEKKIHGEPFWFLRVGERGSSKGHNRKVHCAEGKSRGCFLRAPA